MYLVEGNSGKFDANTEGHLAMVGMENGFKI